MAATETSIGETISPSLQLSLFGFLYDKEFCEPGPEKSDEYNRAYLSNLATELLRHVGYGRQDKVELIIKKYPDVLLFSPSRSVKDIAGNLYAGTAFQYALWAMDTHMYNMMLDCLPQNEQGETIRKGLLEQAKVQTEHFNFNPLITALETYLDNHMHWPLHQRDEHLCRVVGGAQKTLPAHVRHEYCSPNRSFYPVPSFTEKVLLRSLIVYDEYGMATRHVWDESLFGLGSDFAILRGAKAMQGLLMRGNGPQSLIAWLAEMDLDAIIALSRERTLDFCSLMQRLQLPIWKPDSMEVVQVLDCASNPVV